MEKIENSVCNIILDNSYKNISTLEKYDAVLIITDQNVYNYQINRLMNNIKGKMIYEYIIPSGEESKSLEVYEEIIKYCIRINLSRKSLIIAFGGGVVGDLAGFIASTYMRGIDLIQVPTSLLSQVDSSVGGKTGINIGNLKNIIGTFYQPKISYVNVEALQTLPNEEFLDGIGEVIKYSLIYDYELLNYLVDNSENILNKESENLYYIVKRCISIKAHIVEVDEKESGLRKILNFGHTFGHGIEKLCNISHGRAITIGMNMAFKLALKKELIGEAYYNEFLELCNKYSLSVTFEDIEPTDVLNIMKNDKKNSFGKINVILPISKGEVKIFDNIEENLILDVIKECKNA